MKLRLKVVPKASRDEIVGWLGDALKVSVTAPPVRGAANDAVIALLAAALGVPQASISIVAGETSARKTVEIVGLGLDEVRARLSARRTRRHPEDGDCRGTPLRPKVAE